MESKEPKITTIEKTAFIKGLELKVRDCDSEPNEVSWGMQEGILISKNDAERIIQLLKGEQV